MVMIEISKINSITFIIEPHSLEKLKNVKYCQVQSKDLFKIKDIFPAKLGFPFSYFPIAKT